MDSLLQYTIFQVTREQTLDYNVDSSRAMTSYIDVDVMTEYIMSDQVHSKTPNLTGVSKLSRMLTDNITCGNLAMMNASTFLL